MTLNELAEKIMLALESFVIIIPSTGKPYGMCKYTFGFDNQKMERVLRVKSNNSEINKTLIQKISEVCDENGFHVMDTKGYAFARRNLGLVVVIDSFSKHELLIFPKSEPISEKEESSLFGETRQKMRTIEDGTEFYLYNAPYTDMLPARLMIDPVWSVGIECKRGL